MSSTLGSQCLVLATAIAVSAGTIILFDLVLDICFSVAQDLRPPKRILRSCLSSGNKERKNKNKETKKVRFAPDVKDPKGDGKVYRQEHMRLSRIRRNCSGNDRLVPVAMPANRAALYNGILKDRLQSQQRMACSY